MNPVYLQDPWKAVGIIHPTLEPIPGSGRSYYTTQGVLVNELEFDRNKAVLAPFRTDGSYIFPNDRAGQIRLLSILRDPAFGIAGIPPELYSEAQLRDNVLGFLRSYFNDARNGALVKPLKHEYRQYNSLERMLISSLAEIKNACAKAAEERNIPIKISNPPERENAKTLWVRYCHVFSMYSHDDQETETEKIKTMAEAFSLHLTLEPN